MLSTSIVFVKTMLEHAGHHPQDSCTLAGGPPPIILLLRAELPQPHLEPLRNGGLRERSYLASLFSSLPFALEKGQGIGTPRKRHRTPSVDRSLRIISSRRHLTVVSY